MLLILKRQKHRWEKVGNNVPLQSKYSVDVACVLFATYKCGNLLKFTLKTQMNRF